MKIKKLLVALLAVVMAVGVMTAVAACDDPEPAPSPENTKSFQLTGEFRQDLQAMGQGFDFMLDLNKDGSAVLARYNPFGYDSSDAASNKSYAAKYMEGTWKEAKKDGVDCLQIKLAVKKADGTEENANTFYAYDVAGVYSFDLNFPIVPEMSFTRDVTLTGGETKTYADGNAFIQAKKMTFEAPAHVTTFESEKDGKVNATAYVASDAKIYLYTGYTQIAQGTYSKNELEMKVIINDSPINVAIDDNKGTFEYTYDMGGYGSTTYTFVCKDITKVPAQGPATFEPVRYEGTVGGTTYSIVLTSETDCKYANKQMESMFSFECTYAIDETTHVITLTIKQEPSNEMLKGLWAGMKDIVWTLGDNGAMTGVAPAEQA